VVNFQNLFNIEIETIADNFNIDALFTAILVENRKGGIDVGMLLDKTEKG
jgi:hypothetical protein